MEPVHRRCLTSEGGGPVSCTLAVQRNRFTPASPRPARAQHDMEQATSRRVPKSRVAWVCTLFEDAKSMTFRLDFFFFFYLTFVANFFRGDCFFSQRDVIAGGNCRLEGQIHSRSRRAQATGKPQTAPGKPQTAPRLSESVYSRESCGDAKWYDITHEIKWLRGPNVQGIEWEP